MKIKKNTILITLEGGAVQNVVNIPKGIKIEIHDYDVPGDWDEEDTMCDYDEDGNRYQRIVFNPDGSQGE